MAFELVIEDGSGVTGANSYVTISEVDDYCEAMNYTSWESATDAEKSSAIYRSMQFFESLKYLGVKTDYTNPLEFPRQYIYLDTGDEWPDDEIPQKLKNAVCEGAYLEYSSSGSLFVSGGDVKRVKRKKIDVLETEYFLSRESVPYPKLKKMVNEFIKFGLEAVRT